MAEGRVRNAATMGHYGSSWQYGGYAGSGNVEPLLGSLSGRSAIICGGGKYVMEETVTALHALKDCLVFAVNDVGMFLPHVDHYVSWHADNLYHWLNVRRMHHPDSVPQVHSDIARPYVHHNWDGLRPMMALSGLGAMQIAYLMGCNPIVLCGVPGEKQARFTDLEARVTDCYGGGESDSYGIREQLVKECQRVPAMKAAVRSMGGWTKEFFGAI